MLTQPQNILSALPQVVLTQYIEVDVSVILPISGRKINQREVKNLPKVTEIAPGEVVIPTQNFLNTFNCDAKSHEDKSHKLRCMQEQTGNHSYGFQILFSFSHFVNQDRFLNVFGLFSHSYNGLEEIVSKFSSVLRFPHVHDLTLVFFPSSKFMSLSQVAFQVLWNK